MAEVVRTVIYKLHYDPDVSEHVGFLWTQQRLAYNHAVPILNEFPDIRLWASDARPDNLTNRIRAWVDSDKRATAPKHVLKAAVQQAWRENDMKQRQHKLIDSLREPDGLVGDQRPPPTLTYRSRKRDPGTVIFQIPPTRVEGTSSEFKMPGRKELAIRTKKPVPSDLNIVSFKLVEIRRNRRGANGDLRKRRYTLHLDVLANLPEPRELNEVECLKDVLGLDDCNGRRVATSDGDAICADDSETIRKEQRWQRSAARKRRGSKRQQKVLSRVRRSERRRRANSRRLALQRTRELYRLKNPKVVAIAPKSYRAKMRPLKRNALTPTKKNGPLNEPLLSEYMQTMIAEAKRQGIRIYTLLPHYENICGSNGCRRRECHESQVATQCRRCGSEKNADLSEARRLQQHAFECIMSSTGRPMYKEDALTGRRVRPSCEGSQGADKPKSEPDLLGNSLHAGSPGERGAQRPLVSPTSEQYIITDELFYLFERITDDEFTESEKKNAAKGLANWVTWATVNGYRAFPAETSQVAEFLSIRGELGCRPATLRHYATAITRYHRVIDEEDPITRKIAQLIRNIEKKVGKWGRQAPGLKSEQIAQISISAFTPIRFETADETHRRGLKIEALVNVMHDCMLRRSEAANLLWSDVTIHEDGSGLVTIRRSKTDLSGIGSCLYITPRTVQALLAIRKFTGDDEKVFGWNERQISYRIKQAVKFAGLNENFSSHSLRRGTAQELARENFSMDDIKDVGRWETDSMAIHYATPDDPREGAVAQLRQRAELIEDSESELANKSGGSGTYVPSGFTNTTTEEPSQNPSPDQHIARLAYDNPKQLGSLIRLKRKDLGMTQKELAEVIGVRHGTVSGWELGKCFPMPISLERIAKVLGWS